MIKIYTKTGDKGKTSLFDGTRVYKNNPRVETYGTIDELNSVIGIIVSELKITHPKGTSFSEAANYELRMKDQLTQIQNDLFEIGANLANPKKEENPELMQQLEQHTRHMEQYIDELTLQMPELMNFILPGGGKVGALLQLARTVARRAERNIVALAQNESVALEILMYLNRLSDVFHTMSRYANFKENKKETIWISKIK